MAKKKRRLVILARTDWGPRCYKVFTGDTQLCYVFEDWVRPNNAARGKYLATYCDDEWKLFMPNLTLKPGKFRYVEIIDVPGGEKMVWADDWIYYWG